MKSTTSKKLTTATRYYFSIGMSFTLPVLVEQLLRQREQALWREINKHWTIPDNLNKKVNTWIARGDFHDQVMTTIASSGSKADALLDDTPSCRRRS